ncbi:hypothetical protein SAMN04488027_10950 [Psychroflexus sediminis]|uniref:Uncharacterized protein n=1 Tax=Psychroflexus sediminis TaxID=470826 RepID=A0A1G7XPJ1_9FLAO|nr:hypothetical protein SAMN04488027_10950 [Psychroflexus sediminis]
MRLSNHKLVRKIPGIYYFSVIFFLLLIFLNQQLGKQLFPSSKYYYASHIVVGLWLIYIYFAGKYFEYDSEGSLVSFLNRGAILSEFINYRTNVYEIKKEKIKYYKIYNLLFYRRLMIAYSTNGLDKYIYTNISMLSAKKTRYLKLSLDKIIAKNQINL